MNPKALVKEYLAATNIMQLGTSVDNQPWVCTVHYAYVQDSIGTNIEIATNKS